MRVIEIQVVVNLDEEVIIRRNGIDKTFYGNQLLAAKQVSEALSDKSCAVQVIRTLTGWSLTESAMLFDAAQEITISGQP